MKNPSYCTEVYNNHKTLIKSQNSANINLSDRFWCQIDMLSEKSRFGHSLLLPVSMSKDIIKSIEVSDSTDSDSESFAELKKILKTKKTNEKYELPPPVFNDTPVASPKNSPSTTPKRKSSAHPLPPPPDMSVQIKNGINDLTNLPIDLLQMELIKRGYHPGVIKRLDQWYLVSILRETQFEHYNYFARFESAHSKIFNDDAEEEKKRLMKEQQAREKFGEDGDIDSHIDPTEFARGDDSD
ncbi:hypothetical protein TRFO_20192 [Tritrichomonas foetus]|uniref:Uncharacterized protein n=1 Tax=Tritrichomonas foetus TaxID=1144522 RepID=A0A1J4KL55_9EUKA|nr:hypothetical protein TRFO_20192 [Tritrichomonas foetus]|eukprot:OHT10516.1 hypothetical protein TRFO_20192 [Tritrichomonas foetus]